MKMKKLFHYPQLWGFVVFNLVFQGSLLLSAVVALCWILGSPQGLGFYYFSMGAFVFMIVELVLFRYSSSLKMWHTRRKKIFDRLFVDIEK